jgi:hypothetical protein
MAHGKGYIWLFENETDCVTFNGSYSFELNNLKFSDGGEDETTWAIKLEPGTQLVKKLDMVDPTQAWGYKYSYSFKCNEVIPD